MKLYLVRHGQAVPRAIDPDCPLREQGAEEIQRLGAFLAAAGVRVSVVLHSGKTRARQTAEILAESLCPGTPPKAAPGLKPLDAPSALAPAISDWTSDTLVVGHLPFMARLVSLLLSGDQDATAVAFQTGTVVCLETSDCGWAVTWIISPGLLPGPPQQG